MEDKLVAEVKRKRPTLKGLVSIMRKYRFADLQEMKRVFMQHNLVIHINTRDPIMKKISQKNAKQVSTMYKEMRSIRTRRKR